MNKSIAERFTVAMLATAALVAIAAEQPASRPQVPAQIQEMFIGGVSYVALLARESKDRNTLGGIWVLGLGTDPAKRLVRRLDDGEITGVPAVVLEPEPFVGKNEAYVYYNYFRRASGKHGLRRASTGIKVAAASAAVRKTHAFTNVAADTIYTLTLQQSP